MYVALVTSSTTRIHYHREFLLEECRRELEANDDDMSRVESYIADLERNEDYLYYFGGNMISSFARRSSSAAVDADIVNWVDIPGQVPQAEPFPSSYPLSIRQDSFTNLVSLFGKRTMVLWKLVLLQKRIMFLTSCPIDEMCQQGGSSHRYSQPKSLSLCVWDTWRPDIVDSRVRRVSKSARISESG